MRAWILTGTVVTTVAWALATQVEADGGRLRATVAATVVPAARVLSVIVEGDVAGVESTAVVVLAPRQGRAPAVGDDVSIDVPGGGAPALIFKGEITGIEPFADASGRPALTLRALNRLHRLARTRKSRVFEQQTDSDIVSAIAREAGLAFGSAGPEAAVVHDRVVQFDQTDLDFLRQRAARIGYEVFVGDSELNFVRPADVTPVRLGCAPARGTSRVFLKTFSPASRIGITSIEGHGAGLGYSKSRS